MKEETIKKTNNNKTNKGNNKNFESSVNPITKLWREGTGEEKWEVG